MYHTYIYDKISQPSYAKELNQKKKEAKKGEVIAELEYGTACFYGVQNGNKQIVKEDPITALEYAKKCSSKNNPDGHILLGLMQMYGVSMEKDVSAAFNSFFTANKADPNNLDAQFLLSYLYYEENYKEIDQATAFQFLTTSGSNDRHNEKQAMFLLGKIYYEGKEIQKDYSLALRYFSISAESIGSAQNYLKEVTKMLTNGYYELNFNSSPKKIYLSAQKILQDNGNSITPIVEEYLQWAQRKNYPPAIYDLNMLNQSRGLFNSNSYEQIEFAAKEFYLPAIDQYVSLLLQKQDIINAVLYAKHSIYFKSNAHQNTIAIAYRNEVQNSIDPGIYFRYRRYIDQFDEFDLNLINQIKLKALQNGTPEEMYNYAICLENGFANLPEDKETAVQMYKIAADKCFEPASRNYAHFQEFGEFTQQDFAAAIKRIEKYTDIEATTSVAMMKMMLSDNLALPFPYSKKYKKLISNMSRNPGKSYSKIALLLIKNKLIIPNFKMAEKFANKAKKQFSLATAVLASIEGDPRAGKPNPTKADKMFKEALSESKMQEIKDLYAEFLISEGRENELEKLGIIKDDVEEQTSRPKTAAVSKSQQQITSGPAVLVEGEDLFNGYLSSKDDRLLERSAAAGYPVAMSCYSQYILKHKLKKQYKLAFSYLESSAEQGIFTSYVLLGFMYDRGIFVKKDHYEALGNYLKAIENYEYKGFFGLSFAYTLGKIFDKDLFMAYRYYKIAEKITSMYITPYEFDQYLFADQGCLKAEPLICHIDTNKLKTTNAKDSYLLGFHKEYAEKDFTGAFHCYLEANKLNPKNNLYKRSLAYFYLNSLGSTAEYSKAIELYTELGNEDDQRNISIAEFHKENPIKPLYIYKNNEDIFDKIKDGTATSDEMYIFGHKLLAGEGIEQNYIIATYVFELEQERYDDGKSSRMIAKMIEKGYGQSTNKERIAELFYRAAIHGDGDACYNVSKLLASGQGIYVHRVQASFMLEVARINGYTVNEDFKEHINNQLTTRKDVFDPVEEFFVCLREIKCPRISVDNIPITRISYPLIDLKPFPPSKVIVIDQYLFLQGLQYMKGLGVTKNYNLAFKSFGEAIKRGSSSARVYFAVLACITKVSHYEQIYRYNMFKAKLNGHSFAYVEEAKIELGIYENVSPGNKELAISSLQKAIDAGDTYALYIKGRYLDDPEALEEASQKGCGKASYYIGKRFLDMGQASNAIPYLEKATNQGHLKSNYYLGLAYLHTNNIQQAEKFLSKGANSSGNSNLMVRYGLERLEGNRISKNEIEAAKMFKNAHEIKNMKGTLNYAICLRDGIGLEKDLNQAATLFEVGIQRQIPEFYEPASICFKSLKGLSNWSKYNKCKSKAKGVQERIYVKNDDIINDCFEIQEDNEFNPWYNYQLARNHKMKDLKKYVYYLHTATNLGIFSAIKETILHLFSGLYVDEDEDEAYRLLSHMLAINWGTAYKILGDLYFTSDPSFHKEKAYHYYKKAAILKSKSGMYKYGIALSQGIGCEKNPEKGHLVIDKSKCKYAYNYLTMYTNYKPKYAKEVPNCLSSIQNILNDKFTDEDVKLAAIKDIKYGIIFYNIYYWKNDRSFLSPMAMVGLKYVANNGSSLANFHYGFVHYTLKHYIKSIPYLKYAADRHNYSSCHYLGNIFYMDEYFNLQMAKKYLSESATHLNDAHDCFKMGTLTFGDESIMWLDKAIDIDPIEYAYKIGLLYTFGCEERKIKPDIKKAEYIFMRNYTNFTYEQIEGVAGSFYTGSHLNKDLVKARYLYSYASEKEDRTNENCTKQFIRMCMNGEGGDKYFPEHQFRQIADSDDPERLAYSYVYGKHLYDEHEYSLAVKYLERVDTVESRKMVYECRQKIAEQSKKSQRSGGGGLIVGAAYAAAVIAAPVATVAATVAVGSLFSDKKK